MFIFVCICIKNNFIRKKFLKFAKVSHNIFYSFGTIIKNVTQISYWKFFIEKISTVSIITQYSY